MKTFGRIIILLSFALLVVSAVYGLRLTDWGSQLLSATNEGERPDGEGFTSPEDAPRPSGDFEEEASGETILQSFASFAKTLVPVTLLILVINLFPALFQALLRRVQRMTI